MTKKLKTFNVVLQYDVQKIYTVSAKNQEQAEQLVMDGKGYSEKSDEDWDCEEVLEVMEVA